MPPPRYALVALLLAAAVSACAAPPTASSGGEGGLSMGRLSSDLSRLAGPSDSASVARRLGHVAEQMRQAGLQPVLQSTFEVRHLQRSEPAYVLGYVAGRNPNVSSRIVLLTSDHEGAPAAGVLEAARLLVADARTSLMPERTVGVAVWGGGTGGVEAFLARPPWALEGIEQVLMATTDTLRAAPRRELWEARGIPVRWVSPSGAGPPEAGRAGTEQLALAYRFATEAHIAARAAAATPLAAPLDPDTGVLSRRPSP